VPVPIFSQARRGISLLEVLVSVFIVSIGLFGVVSLVPVGNHEVIEGVKMDRAALIGKYKYRDFRTRGFYALRGYDLSQPQMFLDGFERADVDLLDPYWQEYLKKPMFWWRAGIFDPEVFDETNPPREPPYPNPEDDTPVITDYYSSWGTTNVWSSGADAAWGVAGVNDDGDTDASGAAIIDELDEAGAPGSDDVFLLDPDKSYWVTIDIYYPRYDPDLSPGDNDNIRSNDNEQWWVARYTKRMRFDNASLWQLPTD